MRRFLKRSQFILMLTGLSVLFLNFSNPKLAKETVTAITHPLKVNPKALGKGLGLSQNPAQEEKRYVRIEGKLYEYNPRNAYNVNGTPTMYKNGEPKTLAQINAQQDDVMPTSNLQETAKMVQENPLTVYTPGGMKKVMDSAHEAAAQLEKHNKALKELDQ